MSEKNKNKIVTILFGNNNNFIFFHKYNKKR